MIYHFTVQTRHPNVCGKVLVIHKFVTYLNHHLFTYLCLHFVNDDLFDSPIKIGIEAVSTHGDKDQEERNKAVQEFRAFRKDVLVATDVASKGMYLSFINS